MKHARSLIAVLWIALSLAACANQPDTPDTPPPTQQPTTQDTAVGAPAFYEGIGAVVSIMSNRRYIVIDHEAIPGYMDAMSMPFPIPDSTLLQNIQPGDSITFRITPAGQIQAIEKKK